MKKVNFIVVALPILMLLVSFWNEDLLIFSLLFSIITGFVQISIGIKLLFDKQKKKNAAIYLQLVVLYFLLLALGGYSKVITIAILHYFAIGIPILLATYLTAILHLDFTSFLKAKWKNLVFINYSIQPDVLKPYLPAGTELDFYHNKCYVSLVGFMFEDTKVLGLKIPKHQSFEEVNLRFYVKRFENNKWKRGVVFIKEIVPKKLITTVANNLYNEHYETKKMSNVLNIKEDSLQIEYDWEDKKTNNYIKISAYKMLTDIEVDSETEFITEHYYGYTKVSENKTFEYRVTHPKWKQYNIKEIDFNIDYGTSYGSQFGFLNTELPKSIILAKGSEVSIHSKKTMI